MQSTFMLMLGAALFGSGLAVAQSIIVPEPAKPKPDYLTRFNDKFDAADRNDDRALTKSEAQAGGMRHVAKHFDRLDANHDGKVSREEMRALVRGKLSS